MGHYSSTDKAEFASLACKSPWRRQRRWPTTARNGLTGVSEHEVVLKRIVSIGAWSYLLKCRAMYQVFGSTPRLTPPQHSLDGLPGLGVLHSLLKVLDIVDSCKFLQRKLTAGMHLHQIWEKLITAGLATAVVRSFTSSGAD